MRFRPCIDIHNGKVKQIVGGSLKDQGDQAAENFVAEQDAAWYAALYQEKKLSGGRDIGYVGEVTKVNTSLLDTLLDNDFIPVICPVGSDDDFHSYNVNADDAACAIATAVQASKLAFLTDIEGVYRDPLDKSSLISELTIPEAEEFLQSGNVGGGMLPKLQNCIDAIKAGVSRVHILDGRIEHCLLLEFFTDKGIGTAIIGESEERYFSGEVK